MAQDLADDREAVRAFFGASAPPTGMHASPTTDPPTPRPWPRSGCGPATPYSTGCGTGRALPALRDAVGPRGTVLGADLTPEMLAEVVRAGRGNTALLFLTDVARLPLRRACLDAVFGAGLISHLPGPQSGLRELARVVRPRGRLALFHPVGRAALAARRGRRLTPDDVRAEPRLRTLLDATGWRLVSFADEDDGYLALAERLPR